MKLTMSDKEITERPRPPSRHRHKPMKMRVLVKGYMRPDGSSYHVVIPKKIRELMRLEGGEYFLMAASARRDEICMKKVELFEEEE